MPGRLVSSPRLFSPLDALVVASVLAAATWAWFAAPGSDGARAVVYVDGKKLAWWNLSGPSRRDTVRGVMGAVVVEHGQGSVRIASAPCPHQLCVRAGKISRVRSELACVPSHLVVVVECGPDGKDGLDAVP